MQKWLSNNNILIYFTHNEKKSVITERFTKKLKARIYIKIAANDSKSYLSYLSKLVDQYNKTYHHCIGSDADYLARIRIANYKYIFSKRYTDNLPRETFIIKN